MLTPSPADRMLQMIFGTSGVTRSIYAVAE